MFGRTQGALAATLGLFAWGACSAPTEISDLRPDGPPEVLTVLVADLGPDPANDGLIGSGEATVTETATFCKIGDNKRPGFVNYPLALGATQMCPDDLTMGVPEVTDAQPLEWYVRVMFDELLNPDIEDLIPNLDANGQPDGTSTGTIKNTLPFTLTCAGVDVPYDGFYGPEGNNVTWPVGPSLFVAPNDPTVIATSSACTITLKSNIVDKDGNQVPADQIGPYKFTIAQLAVVGTTPGQPTDPTMPDIQDPTVPDVVNFNAFIDATTVTAADVTINIVTDCTAATGTPVAATVTADPMDPTAIDISDSTAVGGGAWTVNKFYQITFDSAATVKDINGGPGNLPGAADLTICFSTASS
jgi:hypothetical protein